MNYYEETCEFCKEIKDFNSSRVGSIYERSISSRIIRQNEHFIVLPTIGQIVPKSLLLLPKKHYETFAQIETDILREGIAMLDEIENKLFTGGNILFEHGAKKCTSASCGVYHAHIHIVPIEGEINFEDLVGTNAILSPSIEHAFNDLKKEDNYIFFKNTNNRVYYNTIKQGNPDLFKSQYFRRWLSANFFPEKEWDWKKYNVIENDLLESLKND